MSSKRCAIYTRKSSEEGLEQDFNSLHAQREACAAYIASQKHEGWQVIKTHYDDGGYSGGSMERPGLQQLLQDIRDNKVDVIVVYKIDRLTRSLLDFAKMVETFDNHQVSFVSITQSFNTTTSMGRLTLNVLLSFAQFEREVTGERIRDKIAASKKKGIWMGGVVPLGYEVKERMLLVKPEEAKIVRQIYIRYLELGCVRLLHRDIHDSGIRSGKGNIISRGTLYNMLTNPIYIGQIRHKDICHPGQHEAIIDEVLWEQVQQHMSGNRIGNKTRLRKTEPCPLTGKLFDASGERLVPVHAKKNGRRYRYYVSQNLTHAPNNASSQGWRLPGQEIENVIAQAASSLLHDNNVITNALQKAGLSTHYIPAVVNAARKIQPESSIYRFVQRVELSKDRIFLTLSLASLITLDKKIEPAIISHEIPMQMKRCGVEMRLIVGGHVPVRMDLKLIKTIARAHQWFNQLATGSAKNIAEIATRENIDRSYATRVINLAFLAPDIIEGIIAGQQPADLSIEKLTKHIDLPVCWSQQRQLLSFA
jgi:DNA invertase Pin-like site-specific DNA recombinase